MELTQERPRAGPSGGLINLSRAQNPVPFVAALFLTTILFQRIAVPGLPIPITVPLTMAWMVIVWAMGIAEFNRTRMLVWLFAGALSGLVMVGQVLFAARPYISFNSWAFWMVTWIPVVLQIKDRTKQTYLRCSQAIAFIGIGLAILSIAFLVIQLAGVRYYDWFAAFIPRNLLVDGYVTTYPVVYDSPIYKSNGWIALEPSFMSFYLGVSLACGLMARVSVLAIVVLFAGLLSTIAGSGLALIAVLFGVLIFQRQSDMMRRYALPIILMTVLFGVTNLGRPLFSRVTEVGASNSSTALRAVQPYIELWPYWIADPVGIFLGHGAGSSADVVKGLGLDGLLLPSIAKVIFDYGLIGGALLIALMVVTFLKSPWSALAFALAASMFFLQAAAQPLVICCILVTTIWAPAVHKPNVESPPRRSPELKGLSNGAENDTVVSLHAGPQRRSFGWPSD
jgi:hypothetical protein